MILVARDKSMLEDVAAEIVNTGQRALAVSCDVSSAEEVRKMADTVAASFGQLDILVNNAGISKRSKFLEYEDETWFEVIRVNLFGVYLCTKAFLPMIQKAGSGRIINVASVAAFEGQIGQAAYSASKAGLIGLTKTAAKELAPRGITVNAVAPGFIETDMTANLPEAARTAMLSTVALNRPGQPDDIAAAVAFLASDEASFITGHPLVVDGGWTAGTVIGMDAFGS